MRPPSLFEPNHRILIIDDNRAVHDDLREILSGESHIGAGMQEDNPILFGAGASPAIRFEIDSAYQGQEGLAKLQQALAEGRPYALAFVDVRMPPGWDGVETIDRLWQVCPNLQVVVCTAYADYSWNDLQHRLHRSENLLILRKPFDNMEVIQLAHSLSRKWLQGLRAEAKMSDLDLMVAERTDQLRKAHEQIEREYQERAKAQEAFRIIFEASTVGTALLDMTGRCVDVNRALEAQFGLTREQLVGKRPAEMDGASQAIMQVLQGEIAARGSVEGREITHQGRSGPRTGLFWARRVEVHGSPHWLCLLLDITDRKQMEEELRRARMEAEAAARAKSDFLANMSHEIRTPMNGILGFTELALQTQLSADQRNFLETVESSARSLLRIINDILDFSKIEAGRMDLESAPFSVSECLEGAAAAMLPSARQKGLDFRWSIDGSVPEFLTGDATRLRQVLLNLISNAVKFTAKGSVTAELSAVPLDAHRVELQCAVRDTGIGIAPEKQKLIFEPFRQAESSMTRRYGGTGLGLAIVTRLLTLSGGRIRVESREGAGSAFHFALPLLVSDQAPLPAKSSPPARETGSAPLSILVAEDNDVSRLLIEKLLSKQGHSVTSARTGLEALAFYEKSAFDLILMDVQMPDMDGFQATAEIREREIATGGHIPIAALTAHAIRGDRERCLEAGMDEYLSKPIEPRELAGIIGRAAEFKRAAMEKVRAPR